MGIRCGYVLIKAGQPFYKHKFRNLDLICHGGVTYCDWFDKLSCNNDDKGLWAVGFDCGHYLDKFAIEEAIKYGLIDDTSLIATEWKHINTFENTHLRSVVYCQEEIKRMVDQMEDMNNAESE